MQGNTVHCAIDAANRTHVIWVEYPNARLRYTMLDAGLDPSNAANWTSPITVTSVGESWDSQNPDIASIFAGPGGRLWLVYWSLDNSGVFVRNWDASSGWSASTPVSDSGAKHPRIAVDNAGYVHVTYMQPGSGLRYSYMDAGTGQWHIDNALPGGGDAVEQSGVAVNRNTGDVHIVFSATTGCGNDNCRVVKYIRKFGPTGTSFTAPVDLTGQGNHVVTRLAWSESGRMIMVADKRDVRVITMATSDNNGATWSGASDLSSSTSGWPSVVMDSAGNAYVTHWTDNNIYFITIAGPSPTPPGAISLVSAKLNTLTSTSVTWKTEGNSDSRVYFGTAGTVNTACTQEGVCMVTNATKTIDHHITLHNLLPNTTYNYRVRSTNSAGQTLSDTYTFTTPSFEIIGRHSPNDANHTIPWTHDGKFAALVAVPASTTLIEWTTDNQTYHAIQGVVTTIPGVLAFSGDVTPTDPVAAQTFTLKVRFNGNNGQVTNTQDLSYNPAYMPTFSDVDVNIPSPFTNAIYELAGRGIVQGSGGAFRPTDPIARAEVTAFIARALGWSGEYGLKSFNDQGGVDNELWNNVRILADYDVARGFGDGSFRPLDSVTQGQAISLLTRAMVAKGYWTYQPDNPSLFPEVPADSGHRIDLATYYHYIPALTQYFQGANYAAPAQRRGVARVAWDIVQYIEAMP